MIGQLLTPLKGGLLLLGIGVWVVDILVVVLLLLLLLGLSRLPGLDLLGLGLLGLGLLLAGFVALVPDHLLQRCFRLTLPLDRLGWKMGLGIC